MAFLESLYLPPRLDTVSPQQQHRSLELLMSIGGFRLKASASLRVLSLKDRDKHGGDTEPLESQMDLSLINIVCSG